MKIIIDKYFLMQLKEKLGYGKDMRVELLTDYSLSKPDIFGIKIYLKNFPFDKHYKTIETTTDEIKKIMQLPKNYILRKSYKNDEIIEYFEEDVEYE